VSVDFVEHNLLIQTSDGTSKALGLFPRSVAEFYHECMSARSALGLEVTINPQLVGGRRSSSPTRLWPAPSSSTTGNGLATMERPAAWCVVGEDQLIKQWDDDRHRLGRFWGVPPVW
jgi:Family of unknown function (DUF5996)